MIEESIKTHILEGIGWAVISFYNKKMGPYDFEDVCLYAFRNPQEGIFQMRTGQKMASLPTEKFQIVDYASLVAFYNHDEKRFELVPQELDGGMVLSSLDDVVNFGHCVHHMYGIATKLVKEHGL